MNKMRLELRTLLLITTLLGGAVVVWEIFLNRTAGDATLLVVLTYWAGLAQGCVALVAVGELTKASWLVPIRGTLLAAHPLILLVAMLFILMGKHLDVYPWSNHPNGWLNGPFFIARNVVLLVIVYLIARRLAVEVAREGRRKNFYAGMYCTAFIVSQSMVAFDWIMSLEYPWISTLFGGFFFVESFIMGLAVCAVIVFFRGKRNWPQLKVTLRDTALMMFGFCFVWGGFLFTQYLVIWYGNLPEEVIFIYRRLHDPVYLWLSRTVVAMVFAIPFLVLLSRLVKTMPVPMFFLSIIVLSGFFIEKLVFVTPVAAVNAGALAAEMIVLAALLVAWMNSGDAFMPLRAAGSHGDARSGPGERGELGSISGR